MQIIGKDGADMDEVYFKSTESLFGLFRRGFPNLFFCGASQASLTANQLHSMDTFATHIAYIIKESQKRSGKDVTVIEPTNEAQDDWADQVAAQALGLSGMTGCTPNYLNAEGSLDKLLASMGPEEQRKMMRAQLWGRGINHYGDVRIFSSLCT